MMGSRLPKKKKFSLRFGTQTLKQLKPKLRATFCYFTVYSPTIICYNPVGSPTLPILILFLGKFANKLPSSSTNQRLLYLLSIFSNIISYVLALACSRLRSLRHSCRRHYARCLKPHWTLQRNTRSNRVLARTISSLCKQLAHAMGYTTFDDQDGLACMYVWMTMGLGNT
jgi:hypothetical protein